MSNKIKVVMALMLAVLFCGTVSTIVSAAPQNVEFYKQLATIRDAVMQKYIAALPDSVASADGQIKMKFHLGEEWNMSSSTDHDCLLLTSYEMYQQLDQMTTAELQQIPGLKDLALSEELIRVPTGPRHQLLQYRMLMVRQNIKTLCDGQK